MLILLLTGRFWLTALGAYLVDSNPPAHADLIIVLAGDDSGRRILKAGELVKAGFAPQALVSGRAYCCYGVPEHDLAIALASRHGYPAADFIGFSNNGLSTREEATLILRELRRRNVHSIDVVTSNFHTRRSSRIYRSLAPDLAIYMVSAQDAYFSVDGWWKTREGRKIFLEEWTKTVAGWFGV